MATSVHATLGISTPLSWRNPPGKVRMPTDEERYSTCCRLGPLLVPEDDVSASIATPDGMKMPSALNSGTQSASSSGHSTPSHHGLQPHVSKNNGLARNHCYPHCVHHHNRISVDDMFFATPGTSTPSSNSNNSTKSAKSAATNPGPTTANNNNNEAAPAAATQDNRPAVVMQYKSMLYNRDGTPLY